MCRKPLYLHTIFPIFEIPKLPTDIRIGREDAHASVCLRSCAVCVRNGSRDNGHDDHGGLPNINAIHIPLTGVVIPQYLFSACVGQGVHIFPMKLPDNREMQ
jgi:hypothetical protein